MLRYLFILAGLLSSLTLRAARLDSLAVFSRAMQRDVACRVIMPDAPQEERLPTVYLLHGYSGSDRTYPTRFPEIFALADRYQMILVMPDGRNSWYIDSPVNPRSRYEEFITRELIPHIDSLYPTLDDRHARAITGLSMGGHGALYLTILHPDLFGAAGSMSGGVDLRPFPGKWELNKVLGTQQEHPDNWERYSVIHLVPLISADHPQLIFDCGTEDFFFEVNNALHRTLLRRGIPHTYTTRPGEHNPDYWRGSIPRHLEFFHRYFSQQ